MDRTAQSGSVMRLHAGYLATPVLRYRHGDTGRILTLILNNHSGTDTYWAAMRARIGELEAAGAVIRWEGIRPAPPEEWAAATDDERAAHQVLFTLSRNDIVAARLGWVTQGDGLPVPDSWVNADLTDLDAVRAMGAAVILQLGRDVDAALAPFGGRKEAYIAAMAPLTLRRLARPHAWIRAGMDRVAPELGAVMTDHRSKLAAAGVDPGRDSVLIYGAEHADSIGGALQAAGWLREDWRRWLTVGKLPPLPVTVAGITVVLAGVAADTFRALHADPAEAERRWQAMRAA